MVARKRRICISCGKSYQKGCTDQRCLKCLQKTFANTLKWGRTKMTRYNDTIKQAMDETRKASIWALGHIGETVQLKRTGDYVTILSVEFGKALVKGERGEFTVHVAAFDR